MLTLLARWILNAAALLLVAYIYPGVHVDSFFAALVAALVLGLVNAVIRPILIVISLPLEILTLGFFVLVVNGLCFWFVGALHVGLYVDGFWPAFWGALLMSIASWVLSMLTGRDQRRA